MLSSGSASGNFSSHKPFQLNQVSSARLSLDTYGGCKMATWVCHYSWRMDYLNKRKHFAEQLGAPRLFDFIDQWQIYVGQQNLSRFLTIFEVVRETANIDGDIAELGSWQGANLMGIAKVLRHLGLDETKNLYSFDSFEGLTKPSIEDEFDESQRGKYRGDFEKLSAAISLYGFEKTVILKSGLIEETVPDFVKLYPGKKFSLIYFDADFFGPAEVMFTYLAPRLSVGGVILLDEYGMKEWPGETKSADKFLNQNDNFISEKISTAKQPTLRITRVS